MLEFTVTAQGNVTDVKIVSADHPLFGAAAVKIVSQWKFTPGKIAEVATAEKMQVPIHFQLEEKDAGVRAK